jgi:hypothetical protein
LLRLRGDAREGEEQKGEEREVHVILRR